MLLRAESDGKFKCFQLARTCPRVSHLVFVDDLIIFSRALLEDAAVVQYCIVKYQDFSGQKVNLKKLVVMFSHKVLRGLQRRLC